MPASAGTPRSYQARMVCLRSRVTLTTWHGRLRRAWHIYKTTRLQDDRTHFFQTPAIGVLQDCALAGYETHRANGEAGALDHRLVAARAEGRLGVLQLADVADVDVMQPAAAGDLAGLQQDIDRRGRQVRQLVLRMETREVQRIVRPEIRHQPVAHLPDHVQLVGVSGHDQIGHLEPDAFAA